MTWREWLTRSPWDNEPTALDIVLDVGLVILVAALLLCCC